MSSDDLTASGDWMNRYRAGVATPDEQRLLVEYVEAVEAERDAALADVAKLREVANRANRAWLRGDIDGPDGEGPAALLALHRAADTEEAKSDADD